MLITFTIYMVGVMMVIWLERRICAFIQDRRGPNRVGPHGLLQSVADGVKNIMKEETYPSAAYLPPAARACARFIRNTRGMRRNERRSARGGDRHLPRDRAPGLELRHLR